MEWTREEAVVEILSRLEETEANGTIPIGISNRHIHLNQADLELLFGKEHPLTVLKELSQPGQFAARETVCIAGPKGCFSNVRVLGPVRQESQIEISRHDAMALGIQPPVRVSGDLTGGASLCVSGLKGMLVMPGKVIVAKRHLHMTPADAKRFQVSDGQLVALEAGGEKQCVFRQVVVRVSEQAALELHLDVDEANAADLKNGMTARLL